MAIAGPKQFTGDPAVHDKVLRLIVGRVALMLLLLLANLWRAGGAGGVTPDGSPEGLLILFSVTSVLSIAYFGLLRFAPLSLWQVRWQFLLDVVSITWLVVQTGDIISPYVTLYIVLISVAGFFLGKTETLVLAMVCAVAFTTLSVLASNGIVYSTAGEQSGARVLQTVGVNVIAILLVGLLAARLSERRRLSEELKHTEESFADLHLLHERIVESVGAGLITTDLAGRVYAFNRAAEAITSIKANEAIGRIVIDLLEGEIKGHVERCISAAVEGKAADDRFEAVFRDDSREITAECSVVPLLGKSGATTGLIITLQNVTQMRQLEETVRRSDRLAAVGRMAAGLAHEIRNPLGSMSSALQFLQESSVRPKEEEKLMDIVLRESDRMNNIITSFLAFARPTSQTVSGRTEVIDVSSALNDCISLIRHSPEASGSHAIDIRTTEGLRVRGDETQLKQVCWNLARNAIEAMPDGGRLAVEAFAENGHVVIRFEDTGVGMDREMQDRMFEPFVSGSGGTGLGLSIVHRIVQEHNGRISLDSEPGRGTAVRVEFPRVKE